MLFCQTHWCCSVWVAWRVAAQGTIRRACMRARRTVRKTLQLLVSCSRHACRTIPCVYDVSHQRLLDRAWRAAQSHRNRVSRVPSENGVHIHISTFVIAGAAPVSFGGALEVHTGNVLSRTDTEQSGPRAPVALRSFPAMSVAEALLVLRTCKTCEIRVARLALHCSPGVCQRGDAQTDLRHSCMLPPGFPRRHPHAAHQHHETSSESEQLVCVDGQFVHHAPNR